MTKQNIILSALHNDHQIGNFGDYQNKEKQNLVTVRELKNLSIFQIAKFKNSNVKTDSIKIDGLDFPQTYQTVNYNNETRILWTGPDICMVVSSDKNIKDKIEQGVNEEDFAHHHAAAGAHDDEQQNLR